MSKHDDKRIERDIRAVHVHGDNDGHDEYYSVGVDGVTAIHWGKTNGSLDEMLTVRVYVNRVLASEHPFVNVLGVHYYRPKGDVENA